MIKMSARLRGIDGADRQTIGAAVRGVRAP
jgi:hypothetical protein